MLVSGILAVTTRKMLRAATYLLFVLIGTAGLYLLLNYHFLAATQLAVYAGGILVLLIFAIGLTSVKGDKMEKHDVRRTITGLGVAVAGAAVAIGVIMKTKFLYADNATIAGDHEINMKMIGQALMGTGKYGYLLPFEVLSVLLLACIVGAIVIARKR